MSSAFSRILREPATPETKTSIFDERFPKRNQVLANHAPNLAENKIDDTYYSVAEYKEIHSDLILEDFMHPLRQSLKEFKRNPHSRRYEGARIYRQVKLSQFTEKGKGKFKFITCYFDSGILNSKKVTGANSEDVPTFGQLLLFTKSHFEDHLFMGKVTSHEGEGEGIKIKLKQFKDSVLTVDELEKGSFTMMQGDAFFYMYEHLLCSLDKLDERSFPMKQYIISGNEYTKVKPPAYVTEWTKYKLGDIEVPALDQSNWPASEAVKLDESQYDALKKALKEEITLIQGPPGTGKTYFGVRLVKVLLDNIAVWNPSRQCPLLVVCQSNIALDHFLENLLENCDTKKIVRIGNQSESEILKPYLLKELVCRQVAYQSNSVQARSLGSVLKRIDEMRTLLNLVPGGIINFKTFEKWGVIDEKISKKFRSGQHYLKWMGFNVEVNEKEVLANKSGFIVLINDLVEQVEKLYEVDAAAQLNKELLNISELLLRAIKESALMQGEKKAPSNILSLSPLKAQKTYMCWVDALCTRLHDNLELQEEELYRQWSLLSHKVQDAAKYKVLRSNYVIGMTSTAASARRRDLEEIQSPIVVIEEAAEVLEAHVVVSMTQACEHLILLGDHKQLKPCTTTHHLAVDYNLNMSLFERLLRNNVVEGMCLTTQYRMRPEISGLLKPHFYRILNNAPSTENRPHIMGLASSLFFLDHEEPEETAKDGRGYFNPHEANMLINLARYLVYVGHSALDITIISMYSDQRRMLLEMQEEDPTLANVEIASVDSYQGKENEIVLVSLVRSNKAGYIGFLQEDNRVCVALSRAKRGLYIIGNMKCLTKPCYLGGKMTEKPVWVHAKQYLQKQKALGTALVLVCPKHGSSCRISQNKHWYQSFCERCSEEREMEDNKPVNDVSPEAYIDSEEEECTDEKISSKEENGFVVEYCCDEDDCDDQEDDYDDQEDAYDEEDYYEVGSELENCSDEEVNSEGEEEFGSEEEEEFGSGEEEVSSGEEEVSSGEEEVSSGEEEVSSGEEEVSSGEEEVGSEEENDHEINCIAEVGSEEKNEIKVIAGEEGVSKEGGDTDGQRGYGAAFENAVSYDSEVSFSTLSLGDICYRTTNLHLISEDEAFIEGIRRQ